MYNVDDAVARVDSYIVSITDGGAYVGERRLVRIEEVGRGEAVATLVEDGKKDGERRSDEGERLESSRSGRRRGRRGGRGRSRAGNRQAGD